MSITSKALSEAELLKEIYKKLAGESPALDLNKSLSKAQLLRAIAEVAKPIPDEYVPEGPTPLPILETYPETDETKAGQRFWYKSNEWHYMTQDEIDAIGWDVAIGFPAPVAKIHNLSILWGDLVAGYNAYGNSNTNDDVLNFASMPINLDFLGLGRPDKVFFFRNGNNPCNIVSIKNAHLLTSLKSTGTLTQLRLSSSNLSKELLESLFTQLPINSNSAIIEVKNNPGSATCDTSIATAKGYTVVTS